MVLQVVDKVMLGSCYQIPGGSLMVTVAYQVVARVFLCDCYGVPDG